MNLKRKLLLFLTILGISLPLLTSCSNEDENISKGYKLCTQMNSFLGKCEASGLDDEIYNKWMDTNCEKSVPFDELTGENGNINVGTCAVEEPFAYIYNNNYVGVSLDYVYHFAKEYGYSVTIHDYKSIPSVIDSVISKKDDFGACPSTITEERKLSVAFSNPYFENVVYSVILKDNKDIYNSKESLKGQNVGILLGSANGTLARNDIENVNVLEYNTVADLNLALKKGDIKAYYIDKPTYDYMIKTVDDFIAAYVSDNNYYGFIFPKFGVQCLSELEGGIFSVIEGSADFACIEENFENSNVVYYKDSSNCAQSVSSGKSDGFAVDYLIAKEVCKASDNLYILSEPVGQFDVGSIFPKTSEGIKDRDLFNNFLRIYSEDGKLDQLKIKWENYDESYTETYVPYDTLENINGVFKLSIDVSSIPFIMFKDNRFTGLEVELFYEFCKYYGYKLELYQMDFAGLIPSLLTNNAASAMISITDERKESVNFSDSYFTNDIVIVCKTSVGESSNIFEDIKDSFNKTFIKEDRWILFLKGIGNTLIISISAVIGGILIGTLLFMLCKDGNKLANLLVKIYRSFLHNVPIVVILMIFYYIIFGNAGLGGIVVSIIVYSLTFSTSIFGILKNSVDAIGKDQFEAGYALGYKKNQLFFKIIIPQASRFFYSSFSSDVVSLLKETAIVGYIAVMDLTKAGDIVRSRTYEAFFPLITSALIYFVLAIGLVYLVKLIQKLTDPRRKKKNLMKGVVQHD